MKKIKVILNVSILLGSISAKANLSCVELFSHTHGISASQKQSDSEIAKAYPAISKSLKGLLDAKFSNPNLVEAQLTSRLSGLPFLISGQPGSGSTYLTKKILNSELKKMNSEQLNQMIQEFSSLPEVLKLRHAGQVESVDQLLKYDIDQKIKLITYLLEQHTQSSFTMSGEITELMNKSKLFLENNNLKYAITQTIFMTNKLPHEYVESLASTIKSGNAYQKVAEIMVSDRLPNKVVNLEREHSISELVDLMENMKKREEMDLSAFASIDALKPYKAMVRFSSPELKMKFIDVYKRFQKGMLLFEEDVAKANQRGVTNDVYKAPGSDSNRFGLNLFGNLLQSRFLVAQLAKGVAVENLRTVIEEKDLGLLFDLIGHWGPQTINANVVDGKVIYKNDSSLIDAEIEKLERTGTNSRNSFFLKMMKFEAQTFADIANHVMNQP